MCIKREHTVDRSLGDPRWTPLGGRRSGKTHWGPNVQAKSDGWCPAVKPTSEDAEAWGLPTWTLEGGLLLWEDTWLSPCET